MRKPDIKEFIHGFKYEVYSTGTWTPDNSETEAGWYSYTFGVTGWRGLIDIVMELQHNNIRCE